MSIKSGSVSFLLEGEDWLDIPSSVMVFCTSEKSFLAKEKGFAQVH